MFIPSLEQQVLGPEALRCPELHDFGVAMSRFAACAVKVRLLPLTWVARRLRCGKAADRMHEKQENLGQGPGGQEQDRTCLFYHRPAQRHQGGAGGA